MNPIPVHHYPPVGGKIMSWGPRKIRGAYLVEAVITLTIFILLILAAIEMAFLILAYTTTGHLSQQGLRFAMVRGSRAAEEVSLREVGEARADIPADTADIQAYVRGISTLTPVNEVKVDGCWPGTMANVATCQTNSPPQMNNGVNNEPGDPVAVIVTYQYHPMVVPGLAWIGPRTLSSTSVGTVLY